MHGAAAGGGRNFYWVFGPWASFLLFSTSVESTTQHASSTAAKTAAVSGGVRRREGTLGLRREEGLLDGKAFPEQR